jgi:hypothetical protein
MSARRLKTGKPRAEDLLRRGTFPSIVAAAQSLQWWALAAVKSGRTYVEIGALILMEDPASVETKLATRRFFVSCAEQLSDPDAERIARSPFETGQIIDDLLVVVSDAHGAHVIALGELRKRLDQMSAEET